MLRRVNGWTTHLSVVLPAMLACIGIAVPVGAQYPFVPPPLRCIPESEGPGILAGIAPTPAVLMVRRDLAILKFTYLPLSGDSDLALRALRDRLEARLRAVRPFAVRAYAGPAELRSATPGERPVELSALGSQLGARRILAGRIDQNAAVVHVVLDIYDATTGARLWRTDKTALLSDLLSMELALAREVGAYAFGDLTAQDRDALASSVTRDEVAYTHYLRGIEYLRDTISASEAVAEFVAATQQAPKFAEGWSALAVAYTTVASTLLADSSSRASVLLLAMAAANKSTALSPRSAPSWIARGVVLASREPSRPFEALGAYERAVMLEPANAEAHRRLGRAMMQEGRAADAQMHLLRAVMLQPEDPTPLVDLGELELNQHAYGQSCRALDLALSMDPRIASAYLLRAMARLGRRDVRHAWIDAETGRRLGAEVGGQAVSALADVAAHDTASATNRVRLLQRRLKSKERISVNDGGYVALGLTSIGDRRGALDLLERVRPRGPELYLMLQRPGFDRLWTYISFRRLLDEANAGGER